MNTNARQGRVAVILAAAALIVSVSSTGAPALARLVFAENSDKVDGKHAVGSNASVNNRAGKLVATSQQTGRLPNNIIARAPDANLLDGRDSNDFLALSAPAGRLIGEGFVTYEGHLSAVAGTGFTSSRLDVGTYAIDLPGFDPGCVRAFPNLLATNFGEPGQASVITVGTTCLPGDTRIRVVTSDSAGTPKDLGFYFALYSGNAVTTSPPSARVRGNPTRCVLTLEGRSCR